MNQGDPIGMIGTIVRALHSHTPRPGAAARRPVSLLESLGAVAFTAWVLWPLLAPGRLVTGFDTATYSGPNLAVTLDALRHGRLAQWNPYLYGGVSHAGNIQAAPFYPLKAPFAWVEVHTAWRWLVALHVALLAAGMFWLVRRRLGLRAPAGLVAVLTVVGSGAVMIRMLFFEQILVLAWAPWLLGTVDAAIARRGVDGRRSRAAVPALAAVTAAMLCAGHPQIVYVLLPLAGLWAIARAADHTGGADHTGRAAPLARRLRARSLAVAAALVPVVAGVTAGVLLAAPQLLAALDQAGRSANTGGRSLATVSQPGFSVVLRRLPGTWLGDPFASVHSVTSGGYENLTYVGAVATVAALVAVCAAWSSRQRWTIVGLGAIAVAAVTAAVGPRLVFYRVAFELVPGFDQARVPARWSLAAVIAVGLLAALGVDRLGGAGAALDRRLRLVTSALVVAGGVAAVAGPFERPSGAAMAAWVALGGLGIAALWVPARHRAAAVVVLALAGATELGLAGRHSAARAARTATTSVAASDAPVLTWLQARSAEPGGGKVFAVAADRLDDLGFVVASLRPNANVLYRLASPDGYDGGIQVTEAWATTFAALSGPGFQADAPARNQLDRPLDPTIFAELGVQWVLTDATVEPSALAGWSGPVLVDGELVVWENSAYRGTAWLDSGTVTALHRPTPERVELTVSASGGSRLVLTEQWDPGWSATVDGRPVRVVPSGTLSIGLDIPDGTHRVVLTYRAVHLRLGLLLAALGLVGLGAEPAAAAWRHRRTTRSAPA